MVSKIQVEHYRVISDKFKRLTIDDEEDFDTLPALIEVTFSLNIIHQYTALHSTMDRRNESGLRPSAVLN